MAKSKSDIIKSAKGFEFYVSKIWPIHRVFVKSKISNRCIKCAASEHMILLGKDMICNICKNKPLNLIEKSSKSTVDLINFNLILDEAQEIGLGEYDALIAYSGGKDSSYLIRRIQKEFPRLRLLAFTVDNGFMSPVAKENIDNLLPKLNIDHLFIKPASNFYKKLFQYGITHLNKDGGYGTVDFSDGEYMLDAARNIAAEKKIPLILCGYSKYQVINGLKVNSFEYPKDMASVDRTHVSGMPLADFHDKNEIKQWWHPSKYSEGERPRLLFPLYCWDLEEDEIIKSVKEMGLMQEKAVSPIVTNHLFIPVLGVVDVHKFGYTSYEHEFCRMIRDGKADLIHWRNTFEFLEYTSKNGMFVKKICNEMLSEIDLNLSDVGIKFK
jgi:hypothetical protein